MAEDLSLQLLAGSLPLLLDAFPEAYRNWPAGAPGSGPAAGREAMDGILAEVAARLAEDYPYFHPLYAGQMLKPGHPLARAAYALAMWVNPNNHALDGGRASSRMEIEAVRGIAGMFGWTEFLGHLTGGGTMANLEALWVAGQLAPGKRIVASEQAHYTHKRISAVLGIPFSSVPADGQGRMRTAALEETLRAGDVGAVVVTLGSTAIGAVDPLDQVLALSDAYPFRVHVDAAYGGYFTLASNLGEAAARAFACLGRADSIVVDPHKHGLQPYGCGCILFRDPSVGRFYRHDSRYTYFTSEDLHLGEISLECSRAGAAAVALWATQRLLPLTREGDFAAALSRGREAAIRLHRTIQGDDRFLSPFPPELDILVWAVRAPTVPESSRLAEQVFARAQRQNLHLALAQLPVAFFPPSAWGGAGEHDSVTCLRSVLMKPEHLDWQSAIWSKLSRAADEALAQAPARAGGS